MDRIRMTPTPTVDVNRFAAMVKAKRDGRPLRAVCEEIKGVTPSTLSRIERGNAPDLDSFMRLCVWLGVSADTFRSNPSEENSAPPSVPDFIEANLRADRVLPNEAVDALSQMIRFAYRAASEGRFKEKEA